MGFIIGFGDTEKRYEEALEDKIRRHVIDQYAAEEDSYFSESFVNKIISWTRELSKESISVGDEYKISPEHPDRYSYFWSSALGDANHIVFILRINHINRRHAFSPDGWALMSSEKIFYVGLHEDIRESNAA